MSSKAINMTKTQLITEAVAAYKKSLNPKSKWYQQDLNDYKNGISKLSLEELKIRLGNMNAMNDENSTFNKEIRKEEKKMLKFGLFDIGNMKPKNALD